MARDLYGSFGSVPDTSAVGSAPPQPYQNVRATPDMFGAQVGEAMQYQGKVQEQVADQAIEMQIKEAQQAAEAKFNNDYATKFVPAQMDLRNAYDEAPDDQKVHAYEQYMAGLKELGTTIMSEEGRGGYEQRLWQNTVSRQVASETEYAKRELYQSQRAFSVNSAVSRIAAEMGLATQNYNDPTVVENTIQSSDALIELQFIDQGYDPSNPTDAAEIEQAKSFMRGDLGYTLINSAVQRGDVQGAYKLQQQFGMVLPAHRQEEIESVLFSQGNYQTRVNGATAIMNGQGLPESPVGPQSHVQAAVVDAAQAHGLDHNLALTTGWIESSMGKNVGTRGDIGQTGKGGDLPTQASNMVTMLKDAQNNARKALGRDPTNWETYLCYQQGAGGGPALLRASLQNPEARAVDVLRPLYKNPNHALQAVTHNGGNASMTAADFMAMIKKKYDRNAEQADCFLPSGEVVMQSSPTGTEVLRQSAAPSIGDALRNRASTQGQSVQPAATPVEQLRNFDLKLPDMIARVEASEPNLRRRKEILAGLNDLRGSVKAKSEAYLNALNTQADQLIYDEKFTSMDQVKPDLMAALKRDNPSKYNDLKLAAIKNRGGSDNALVVGQLVAEVDSIFGGTPENPEDVSQDRVADAVRLQDAIMRRAEAGDISGMTAKSLVKALEVGLSSVSNNERAVSEDRGWGEWALERVPFLNYDSSNHYVQALEQFRDSGAPPSEVNRMFRDYVVASDKYKFGEKTDMDDAYYAPEDSEKKNQITPESVIKTIKKDQALMKYSALQMLDNPVNAVIGKDKGVLRISTDEPQGKADTRIDLDVPTFTDPVTGKAYIQLPNGEYDEIIGQ